MALDGPLDDETRENLTKSYSASKSLIHVINDLLDLTRAEEGNALFLQDPLDLHSVVEEAVYIYRDEAARNNIGFNVTCTTEKLPATFIGDRSRTKQIIANSQSSTVAAQIPKVLMLCCTSCRQCDQAHLRRTYSSRMGTA